MRYAFVAFYLLTIILGFQPAQADGPPLVGEMSKFNFSDTQLQLSSLSFSDADDNQISLGAFRGKIVVLNLWATWCGPCVMELPALDDLQAAFGTSDIVVVPVSIDRGGEHQASPYLRKMGVHAMTPYFDHSNSVGRMLGASRIPLTIVVGRDGNEIGRMVGTADWSGPEAKSLMKYFITYGNGASATHFANQMTQVSMTH